MDHLMLWMLPHDDPTLRSTVIVLSKSALAPETITRFTAEARAELLHFDAITISWQVGARKPNAAIFHDICSKLDMRPAEAVHIGDSWSADVVGAIRVGLMPVWIHREAATNQLPHHVAAFETLQAFKSELEQLLDRNS